MLANPFFFCLYTFIFFIFGACIGSFLNVVILRTHSQKSLGGRSVCPHCQHTLGIADLVPIASFLFLGGKCRYCKARISWQYPLVEIATGFLFSLTYLAFVSSLNSQVSGLSALSSLIFNLFLVSVLITVTVSDIKWGLIPDKIVFPTVLVALGYQILLLLAGTPLSHFALALLCGVGSGAFFLALILATRGRGMGGGDMKLGFFIGLSLGWPLSILALFLAFLTGAFASVMLILIGKKNLKATIVFGPFLALGAIAALLYGKTLLEVYLKLLGV